MFLHSPAILALRSPGGSGTCQAGRSAVQEDVVGHLSFFSD